MTYYTHRCGPMAPGIARFPRPGDLVRLRDDEKCGTEDDRIHAAALLEKQTSYEVQECHVGSSWAYVVVVGVPSHFNASMFDVERVD